MRSPKQKQLFNSGNLKEFLVNVWLVFCPVLQCTEAMCTFTWTTFHFWRYHVRDYTIPIFMMTAKRSLCNRINTLKSYIESKPDIARWKESDLFGRSYNIWCKFCWIRQWSTQQSPLLFSLDLGSAFKNFSHWSKLLDLCEVRYCTNLLMGTVTVVTHAVLKVP